MMSHELNYGSRTVGQPQEKIKKMGSRVKEERKKGRKRKTNERANKRTTSVV